MHRHINEDNEISQVVRDKLECSISGNIVSINDNIDRLIETITEGLYQLEEIKNNKLKARIVLLEREIEKLRKGARND